MSPGNLNNDTSFIKLFSPLLVIVLLPPPRLPNLGACSHVFDVDPFLLSLPTAGKLTSVKKKYNVQIGIIHND